MLKIYGKDIVNSSSEKVFLRGIALGGWLMMEGYMLGGENIPETAFRKMLARNLEDAFAAAEKDDPCNIPQDLAEEFRWEFRRRFFTEKDADHVKQLGFNCVRIPFNHKLIEAAPFKIDTLGMELLKNVVGWFAKRKIYVILDMHAVPGCQNCDWHSDSEGEMDFYTNPESRARFVYLWKELADVFKKEEWIAAYDIMNEPVVRKANAGEGVAQAGNPELEVLKESFRAVIKAVRAQGDPHIIFLEGHQWAQRVEYLADIIEENRGGNIALSVHFYEPTDFTFNAEPTKHYPREINGKNWDRAAIKQYLLKYTQYDVPVYVGEFGVSTGGEAGETAGGRALERGSGENAADKYRWVEDVVSVMRELDFHWTYWTYKSVGAMPWPDGLFQFFEPYEIFAKGSDHAGMKNIASQLVKDKGQFYAHLDTGKFNLNHMLREILINVSLES